MYDFDPEGKRLPIKIDGTSNGEFAPYEITDTQEKIKEEANKKVSELAKHLGKTRRSFLKSACGAAATLFVMNKAHAYLGLTGGFFNVSAETITDSALAEKTVNSPYLVVDMQTHCVEPSGDWATGKEGKIWIQTLTQVFDQAPKCLGKSAEQERFHCYSAQQLVKEVFLDSQTDIAVVSALWGAKGHNPTPTDYAAEVRNLTEALGDRNRALIHGGVLPNEAGALDFMDEQIEKYQVDAWKLYPQWGPSGVGFFLDDPKYGIPAIEKAIKLKKSIICVHKGLSLPGLEYKYSSPEDMGRIAKMFPQVTFITFHSGFENEVAEGPYNPNNPKGVDRLIKAHQDSNFKPNQGNLYAELGSVWRHSMSHPNRAAHLMGKLLKYFGEDRICWGTDSIWYGSPQDQIQTFASFEISEEFQQKYGYPPLTKTAKEKIFAGNTLRIHSINPSRIQKLQQDKVKNFREQYALSPNPSFTTFGPKTKEQYESLWKSRDGYPT
ncbi:amidohydrolase family protein [Candidatus Nitrosacidococcus tergens]|uniref:Amidohydrolase 2 n=1 Tax=Candidatus Nitrosacidococcus tergens TaxID=553981 RepID=A0A7G1QAE2_9GAMM|nr:amidohydrolase family protein [Candidatus Nitrosacidococcus tergens]CAB1276390.1 Amidohydrolase 2 [Candidatus Nitrosacidococcus tergens]